MVKKLAEYFVPTVPDARVELWLVITSERRGSISMLSDFVAVSPALSWTWTVNVVVWTVLGVPETTVDMIPKDCAIVSPAGSAPDTIFHVSSDEPPPLFAVMKAVYDAHTFPLGIDVVVIISGVIVGVGVGVPGEVVDVSWGVAVA